MGKLIGIALQILPHEVCFALATDATSLKTPAANCIVAWFDTFKNNAGVTSLPRNRPFVDLLRAHMLTEQQPNRSCFTYNLFV